MMVLRLLILVVLVLIVFEGRLIHTMFKQHSASTVTAAAPESAEQAEKKTDEQALLEDAAKAGSDPAQEAAGSAAGANGAVGLAGLSTVDTSVMTASESTDSRISEKIDSPAVVAEQDTAVDDSYFTDAVFIGDSRMEGFRNTSGITQGEFMTSVGMSLSAISTTKVTTYDGEITVYQGLSGRQYGKIYLMLGTNDLGYYPWEEFLPHAKEVLEQFHQLQPGATIYVCSVIYVNEAKVTTSYVNNANVIKVNGYLLQACEELDYCHYINLNELFSNGYQSLLEEASQDGVHLYADYTKMMLDYLKTHYISSTAASPAAVEDAEEETDALL